MRLKCLPQPPLHILRPACSALCLNTPYLLFEYCGQYNAEPLMVHKRALFGRGAWVGRRPARAVLTGIALFL
jgi:hypothetical protein